MRISTLKKRSIYHPNHNEDELFIDENLGGKCVLAVMDGCGTAVESHWSAGLVKKILKKEVNRLKRENGGLSSAEIGRILFKVVFHGFKQIRDLLELDEIELFSTLLLAVIDPRTGSLALFLSGDGLYSVDGEHFQIESNNAPNFFTYHLDEPFDSFFSDHVVKVHRKIQKRFLLATDGINKINDLDESHNLDTIRKQGILKIMDSSIEPNGLSIIYNELRRDHGLYPFDDLAVIAMELDHVS